MSDTTHMPQKIYAALVFLGGLDTDRASMIANYISDLTRERDEAREVVLLAHHAMATAGVTIESRSGDAGATLDLTSAGTLLAALRAYHSKHPPSVKEIAALAAVAKEAKRGE